MAFGLTEEQLRVRYGAVNIAEIDLFAVQRAVGRQRRAQHNRQLSVVRVINQFELRFLRRSA